MFTGIITAMGDVVAAEHRDGLLRVGVECSYEPDTIDIGASICHAGCCLTVVSKERVAAGVRYFVEIAAESLEKTTLGALAVGSRVNLERSLRMGDELGGHMVSGHVDGVGEVVSVAADGEGWRIRVRAPADIAPLIAPKGSIALDGVSLTVNEVEGDVFGVLIIPHTWAHTTLSGLAAGARVNLEADQMARYVSRILAARLAAQSSS